MESIDKGLLRDLYWFNFKMGFLHGVMGLDFARCFEYVTFLTRCWDGRSARLLDIGSYRSPLPLFLVKHGLDVTICDIDSRVVAQQRWARRVGLDSARQRSAFEIVIQDARRMAFENSSFDYVVCISTIEHIPDHGDMEALEEMHRVLKPGGRVFLSFPFSQVYREGRWGRWFQRDYDEQGIQNRLLRTGGLLLVDKGYLIDRHTRRFSDLWYRLPRLIRHSLGWSQILFVNMFLDRDDAGAEDGRVAWLLLERCSALGL